MTIKNKKGALMIRLIAAVILFSVFIKIDSIFQLANRLAEAGWALHAIIIVMVLVRLISAGTVVIFILPFILGFKNWRDWLPRFLEADRKILLFGLLSFLLFGALAAGISLGMGIFKGDVAVVFAYPDIRPDPDVVGWGYFLLALVPGIWEELAFRGLVQSKLRQSFSNRISILLSAFFFSLFHFSGLINQPPPQVIFGAIMAFFFGLGWGYIVIKTTSIVPTMIAHYLVDAFGQIFLGVDASDPALATAFMILLTLAYPAFSILLTKLVYKDPSRSTSAARVTI